MAKNSRLSLRKEATQPQVGLQNPATERFNLSTRLQHGMLVVSLAILMLTGFPIKFAGTSAAKAIVRLFGSFEAMLGVHFAAATLLAVTALFYLSSVVSGLLRRRLDFAVAPRLSDFKLFFQHLAYLIGRRAEPPKFGKFTWWEKFEFWAVVWGTAVMGLSGLTLAFPELAAAYVPRWIIGALRVAHSNEALLAFLALIVGHLFAVHLSPLVFPTSTAWFNGRISLSQLHEDHGLVYEAAAEKDPEVAARLRPSRWAHNRTLIAIELLAYGVIVASVYYTLVPLLLG